jgi:hypothetical protein
MIVKDIQQKSIKLPKNWLAQVRRRTISQEYFVVNIFTNEK